MKNLSDTQLLGRLYRDARGFRRHLFALAVISLIAAPLTLMLPLPIKITIDNVLGTNPVPPLIAWAIPESMQQSGRAMTFLVVVMIFGIAVLQQLHSLGSALLRTYTTEHLVLRLRANLLAHSQKLSFLYHDSRGAHDALYRIHSDALAVESVLVDGLIPILIALATLIAMLVATLYIDWQLTLVALTVAIPLALAVHLCRSRLRNNWEQTKKMESSVLGVVQEVLMSLRVVQAFGQEQHEQRRFTEQSTKTIRAKLRAVRAEGAFGFLVGLLVAAGMAGVLYLGVSHVQSGVLTLGDLVLVLFYFAMVYQPLEAIGAKMAAVQSGLASADRAYALLDTVPEVTDRPQTRPLDRARGFVDFCNVSFSYNSDREILRGIDLRVPAGCRIGLAGTTGAGKTTLVSLLMRFFDPTNGQVLLDGIDLREYKLADLRRQFAIVLQDSALFSTSILENIVYGRPDADEAEVVEAASLANAHEFVSRLPQGYQTQVGERGMALSGGERQRIALARAFLHNAPILILDEPTSSVDVKTEALVIEAIGRLMQGRTTFMISHRPKTLDGCDMLVELEHGSIAQIRESQINVTQE